jgi:salicylate hydroxylase
MGRIYHAKGVQRFVRNDLWRDRSPERFYDAVEWLYGWRRETCLDALGHAGSLARARQPALADPSIA